MSSPAEMKKMSVVTPCKTMRGHTDAVRGVVHLPCGQRIVTCSYDGSLRLWDLESGAQIGDEWRDEWDEDKTRLVARIMTMALSPNGKTIASGNYDGTVRLWDIETGKVITRWEGHTKYVDSVCWSPDGERLVSGSADGTVRVWDVESGEAIQGLNPIRTGHEEVYAVSYSPEATMIATGGIEEDAIKIWDAETGKLRKTIKVEFDIGVWSLTWTSDEKKLISGSGNGLIRIFDTATWQQIADLEGYSDLDEPVFSLALSPNDRLASTSCDDTARLWNLDTHLQVGPPLQHEKSVECVAFSADGKLLSTACYDNNVYVWDVQAILKTAGLEYLLLVPDAQKTELKNKPILGAKATRRSAVRPVPRQVPAGFFDNVQGSDPSSTTSRHHPDPSLPRPRRTFALSWGSGPRGLLARLPQFFRRSQPNADEPIELQQHPGPSTSSRRSPPVVEVPALDDKKALYTARRPERASDIVRRIKNPTRWTRVVLFICCVSPSTDDGH